MNHLRIVSPSDRTAQVLQVLERNAAVLNVVHLPGAARKPPGDVILCDVVHEETSVVLAELRRLGLDREGSIALEEVDVELAVTARQAEQVARGAPADAVVWEQVERRTSESAELSFTFVTFMILATLIAAAGILTDSQILIIGAMVVGPEFGPLAGFCVAIVQRRMELARRSLLALAVGFPVAIAATALGTWLLREAGRAPDTVEATSRPATYFISHPNTFSVIVAVLAGVAGTLSLTTAKSGALVGVLISVTTIPAAANVGVATAYGDWAEFRGALAQLVINLIAICAAGIATLLLQRAGFARRVRRQASGG
ncbi:MAG TPA: DUF389 domain-containing protein [Gaiellaceae bacterium]|nr:DUF389 domain-containing protein [Gaiellaceae bacterium]